MRSVPVRDIGLCVLGLAREQCYEWAWGENVKPFAGIVVRETLEIERDGREGIYKADELPKIFKEK